MGLRERDAGKKDDGAEIEENEMDARQFALGQRRKGAVEQAEQHHRGEAHEIDMGVQMGLIEAFIDADPDAEGKAEGTVE